MLTEHRSGNVQKCATCLSQVHAARAPQKELGTKLPLDEADALTERWLLHAQPLSSSRDVALLGHSHEIAEMPELECHIASDINFVVWISYLTLVAGGTSLPWQVHVYRPKR